MTHFALFRLAAVLLLLITGAELFACEVIAPERCESFGFPKDGGSEQADDNCICCCLHIVVISPIQLNAIGVMVTFLQPVDPPKVARRSTSIYHPPRA